MCKLSIILPVFNGEPYIRDAIHSILNQEFKDFELLVIDDCSSDKTPNIIESIKDPRLKIFRNDVNKGLISSLNIGIRAANSPLIARMDADDISMSNRISEQYEFMEQHQDISVLGTAAEIINKDGKVVGVANVPELDWQIRWRMAFSCPFIHPSIMVRTECVKGVGGYSNNALHGEDFDLWVRLSTFVKFGNLTNYLIKLRKHGDNISTREIATQLNTSCVSASEYIKVNYPNIANQLIGSLECLFSLGVSNRSSVEDAIALIKNLKYEFIKINKLTSADLFWINRDISYRVVIMSARSCQYLSFSNYPYFFSCFILAGPEIALKIIRRFLKRLLL